MKKQTNNSISGNIKKYRLLNNLTQEQLAGLLDLDTQYYAQLERGERNFSIEKIIKICILLHVNIENIIEITPASEENTVSITKSLTEKLNSLSYSQLLLVDKFISEIIPYTK